MTWVPTFLVKAGGLSMSQMAVVGATIYGVYAVSTAVAGTVSDQWIRAGASATRVRSAVSSLCSGATRLCRSWRRCWRRLPCDFPGYGAQHDRQSERTSWFLRVRGGSRHVWARPTARGAGRERHGLRSCRPADAEHRGHDRVL